MVAKVGFSEAEFYARLAGRFSSCLPKPPAAYLLDWGRKYLPSYYTVEASRMHKWLADQAEHFDNRGHRAAVIGPRGGAKSVIGNTTLILERALEDREQSILICSDTATQANEHLRSIKDELEANERIREDYPDASGIGPVWKENRIQMNNGVTIRAVGTLSRIRGSRKRQIRPSLVVIDDPENDQHIESTIMRDRTLRWFTRTVMSMGNRRTNYLAMGTALHREGLINRIVRLPGWETLRRKGRIVPFRSVIEWPTRMDLWEKWENIYFDVDDPKHLEKAQKFYKQFRQKMEKGAKVLWPAYEPLLYLMQLRAQIGHQAFEAEKQGNPINLDTVEWPESYFEDIYFQEWPKRDMLRITALDPSKGKDAKKGDYSAIINIGVTSAGMYYVEADLDRRPVDRVITDTIKNVRKNGSSELGVEVNQFQSLLADEIMQEIAHQNVRVNLHELDNRVKKEVRVRRLSPLLAQKRIKFKAASKGTTLLVHQLRDFPNGDHDDGPDALEMGTRIAATILEENEPVDTTYGRDTFEGEIDYD